jgi:hypothetical protein
LLAVFVGLIVGPIVGKDPILKAVEKFSTDPGEVRSLFQPTSLKNNDTFAEETGTKLGTGTAHTPYSGSGAVATATPSGGQRLIKLF